MSTRHTRVLAAIVVVGCAILALAMLPASAADEHSSVRSNAGNDFATLSVDAHNTGEGTAATGWFEADGDIAKVTDVD